MMPSEDVTILRNMGITIGLLVATGIGLAIFANIYGGMIS